MFTRKLRNSSIAFVLYIACAVHEVASHPFNGSLSPEKWTPTKAANHQFHPHYKLWKRNSEKSENQDIKTDENRKVREQQHKQANTDNQNNLEQSISRTFDTIMNNLKAVATLDQNALTNPETLMPPVAARAIILHHKTPDYSKIESRYLEAKPVIKEPIVKKSPTPWSKERMEELARPKPVIVPVIVPAVVKSTTFATYSKWHLAKLSEAKAKIEDKKQPWQIRQETQNEENLRMRFFKKHSPFR